MPHPKDNELYPVGSKAIWTRPSHRVKPKVVEVVIKKHSFRFDGAGFLNYEVEIIGQPGDYFAAYHDDLDIVDLTQE
jgi:hypothetical protein